MKLMQITSIPENFAVTPSMVETELEEGASFQDELNVREYLFIIDYTNTCNIRTFLSSFCLILPQFWPFS